MAAASAAPVERSSTGPSTSASTRLASLDQFRGYTVLGMLLVNYFGGYAVCPQIWKHTHDYCSYADTIMPQFLFAVGFSLRLTIGRKLQVQGLSAALDLRILRRLFGLVVVALLVYDVGDRAKTWSALTGMGFWDVFYEPLKRNWFQTLMHIAATSFWLLPVVALGAKARVLWMIGSAVAHVGLSYWFNFVWCNTNPNAIDGGPLGFLTWIIPAAVGTLACDWFVDGVKGKLDWPAAIKRSLLVACGLMVLGYVISCGTRFYDVPSEQVELLKSQKLAAAPVWPLSEQFAYKSSQGVATWLAEPPFVKPPDQSLRKWNYWMMSQRAGTLSYPTFCAGFSLLVFVGFYLVCDQLKLQLPIFRTFGTNALLAYVLHSVVSSHIQPFFPKDSPAWYAYTGLGLFFLVNWMCIRSLEKQGIFLRV